MTGALLIVLLLPSILMVSLSLPSLAIGLIISSGVIIFALIIRREKIRIAKIYLLLVVICGIWIFAAPKSIGNTIHAKQVLSLLAMLICGFAITSILKRGVENVEETIKTVFWILLAIGLVGALDLFRPGSYQLLNRPLAPFSEPSHFAIAFTPFACAFALISSVRIRLFVCIASFALAVLLPNLTLLIGALLISMVALTGRQVLLFVVISCIFGGSVIAIDLAYIDYFTSRIAASETENISRLIYMQGWESMLYTLDFSSGLGVGYQNLGIEPPGQIALLLETLAGSQLNRSDGSFLAPKLVGEFGVVGIIGVLYMAILSIRSGFALRACIFKKNKIPQDIIPLCFTYSILIELFVRGTGYFSPTLLITLFFMQKAVKALGSKNIEISFKQIQSVSAK